MSGVGPMDELQEARHQRNLLAAALFRILKAHGSLADWVTEPSDMNGPELLMHAEQLAEHLEGMT